MAFLLFILYFYGWCRTLVHLLSLWLYPLPRAEVYAWSDKLGHMTRFLPNEKEEYNRYYLLFKESIVVFNDTLRLQQALAEMPRRGPFCHFMEAEISFNTNNNNNNKTEEQVEDVTCLLNKYDDGHGTFYHSFTNHTLTPADLYDFSQKKFLFNDNDNDTLTLTLTPMDTLEPRTFAAHAAIKFKD